MRHSTHSFLDVTRKSRRDENRSHFLCTFFPFTLNSRTDHQDTYNTGNQLATLVFQICEVLCPLIHRLAALDTIPKELVRQYNPASRRGSCVNLTMSNGGMEGGGESVSAAALLSLGGGGKAK